MKLALEVAIGVVIGGLALDGIHAAQTLTREHLEAVQPDSPPPRRALHATPIIPGQTGPTPANPAAPLTPLQQEHLDDLLQQTR